MDKEEKRSVVTLIFDDRTHLIIRKKDFKKLPLEKNEETDIEAYTTKIACLQAPEAYEDALSILDYSARTESEMKRKLLMKGYLDMVAQSVIERLREVRLLDDRYLAGRIAENAGAKGVGAYALKRKLKMRGIGEEDLEYAFSLMNEEDEKKGAVREAERLMKKYASFPLRERKAKLSAALSRRGYSWDAVSDAIERILNADDEFDD